MLTEGVVGSRVRIGAWLVAEDRNRAYDGSGETDNLQHERTTIRVPLFTLDVRLTEQLGILPVYRSLANRQLDSSAIFQFGLSRSF